MVPIKWSGERLSVMMAILPMPSDFGDDASEFLKAVAKVIGGSCKCPLPPPPPRTIPKNCYRGIHLVVAEGRGVAVSVTMIPTLGRCVLLENEARCSF